LLNHSIEGVRFGGMVGFRAVKCVPIFRTRHKDLREARQDFRFEDGVERKPSPRLA